MKTKALIDITVPGTVHSVHNSKLINDLCALLDANGIKHHFVDTVPAWGCLNQDWLEFEAEIDPSCEWVKVMGLDKPTKDFHMLDLRDALHHGSLIMVVHTKNKDGEITPFA